MIKKGVIPLLVLWALSSCGFHESNEVPATENYPPTVLREYGYDFVIFDGDGGGAKEDVAKLTCLGMSGGYGAFRLEIFVSGEKSYTKVFDSEEYAIDGQRYKELFESVAEEVMIDTFYSIRAFDVDEDGCDELVCYQYAWTECHSNRIGDVVSTFKVGDNGIEIIDVRLETKK